MKQEEINCSQKMSLYDLVVMLHEINQQTAKIKEKHSNNSMQIPFVKELSAISYDCVNKLNTYVIKQLQK